MYTLNSVEVHAVCYGIDLYNQSVTGGVSKTLSNKATDSDHVPCVLIYDARGNGGGATAPTITGEHQNRVTDYTAIVVKNEKTVQPSEEGSMVTRKERPVVGTSIVRRLTPRECERLQHFPDDWSRWGVNEKGEMYELPDSARYRLQGNSIARPFWTWLLRRIAAQYERPATLGSLFDGQGGFPLCGMESGIIPVWASEIDKHAIAVSKYHFPEEGDAES